MISDTLFKRQAIELLAGIGFTCRGIPEGATQSADLEAVDSVGQLYLFELKMRTRSWQDDAEPLPAEDGSIALHRMDPTAASNSLARVFEKAATQLSSSAQDPAAFRLLWFAVEPSDVQYHYVRIFNTAYGITHVAASGHPVKQGFYIHHAAFAAWPQQIDGVLLGGFASLLLNDLSPRYQALKASSLAVRHGNFVVDPPALRERGECYYLDPTEPDASPDRSVDRLTERYGLTNVHLVDLTRFGAAIGAEDD